MASEHSTKWFWSDWLGDQDVRRLTLAERGLWIDLLALASVGSPIGYVCDDRGRPLPLEEIRRVSNAATIEEVAELIAGILDKGAASRDRAGRLFNRRMVRDHAKAAKLRKNSAKGGEATSLKWKGIRTLLGQNASQPASQERGPPYPLRKIITSSELGTAREGESPSVAAFRERAAARKAGR